MRISGFLSSLVAAAVVSFGPATFAATIDFDALDSTAGQPLPLATFTEDGFTFGLTSEGSSSGPVIFNTFCTGYGSADGCNGDIDLVPGVANTTGGNQGENGIAGNILILQEASGSPPIPNDDASANVVILTLTSGPAFYFSGASAVDDGTFTFYSVIGATTTLLGSITLAGDNDTGMTTFLSELIGIGDAIRIEYSGSGGIDALLVNPVPLPAALPLLLAALAGLGLFGWRRRHAAA